MKFTKLIVLAGCIGTLTANAAEAPIPLQRLLTLQIAQAIVQEAVATCHASGYRVSALVVDSLNVPKAFLRDDWATPNTAESAKMKATTAMLYERPSGPVQDPGVSPPPATIPGTSGAQGAIPIKVGDVTIGAIGVSGGPLGSDDLVCAKAGLAKVADKLK